MPVSMLVVRVHNLYGVRFRPIVTLDGTVLGLDARWLMFRGWAPIVVLGLLAMAIAPEGLWITRCLAGVTIIAAVVGTSFVHELGHALASRLAGLPVQAIVIAPQGGVTIHAVSQQSLVNMVTAIAGPAANAAFGSACLLALLTVGGDYPLSQLLLEVAAIQWLTALINLLPWSPMDGRRIFARRYAAVDSNAAGLAARTSPSPSL